MIAKVTEPPPATAPRSNQAPPENHNIRALLAAYLKGNEDEFLAYMKARDATTKAMEENKGKNPKAIQELATAEEKALEKLTAKIEAMRPASDSPDAKAKTSERIRSEKSAVIKALAKDSPEIQEIQRAIVAEKRQKRLEGIAKELAAAPNKWFSKTVPDLVKKIAAATEKKDAKAFEKATLALKKALEANPLTKDLSPEDRKKLFTLLTANPAAVVAAHEQAHPITTAVGKAGEEAVTVLKNLPVQIVNDAATSALPPGTMQAVNTARGLFSRK